MLYPLLQMPFPAYLVLILTLTAAVSGGWTWYFSSSSTRPQPIFRVWSFSLGSLTLTAGVQYAPAYTHQKGYYR